MFTDPERVPTAPHEQPQPQSAVMEPRDLKSAASYVNNLLSSRGLLRGAPIDFSRPTKDPETPARIINLVHELLSRRDVNLPPSP